MTNADAEQFFKLGYQHGEEVPITLGDRKLRVPFVKTFSDVPLQQPLLYIDSRGRFGLAVNQGNFSEKYGIKPEIDLFIPRKPN